MSTTSTFRKYRDLKEGERIEKGDEYRHDLDDWRPTDCAGDFLRLSPDPARVHLSHHRPHRRLILTSTTHHENSEPNINTQTIPRRMNPYLIIPQPSTKPQRYMIARNDTIIAKSLTRVEARHIIACCTIAELEPDKVERAKEYLANSGS